MFYDGQEESFRPQPDYPLTTSEFLAAGGDGYGLLKEKGKNNYRDATEVTDLLVDFIREKKVVTAAVIDAL